MSLLQTWKAAVLSPEQLFKLPPDARGTTSPLGFALGAGAIGLPAGAFVGKLVEGIRPADAALVALIALVTSPVVVLVRVALLSCFSHLLLIVVRGRQYPLAETRRCICLAQATTVFAVIPVVGELVALFWGWVIAVIGLARTHMTSRQRAAVAVLGGFALAAALLFAPRFFLLEAYAIPAASMVPTLQLGDHIFVYEAAYLASPPRRGDVIVFRFPNPHGLPSEESKAMVKRVVAVGGDTVEVRDRVLHVNGVAAKLDLVMSADRCRYVDILDEAHAVRLDKRCEEWRETLDGRSWSIYRDPEASSPASWEARQVPPGHVYVLGDNRDNSHDSRFWGPVPFHDVKGRAVWIWWSVADGRVLWKRMMGRLQ